MHQKCNSGDHNVITAHIICNTQVQDFTIKPTTIYIADSENLLLVKENVRFHADLPLAALSFASFCLLYEELPGALGSCSGFSFFILEGMMCNIRPYRTNITEANHCKPAKDKKL